MTSSTEIIETAQWCLRIPNIAYNGRTICIPTVHPVGDQRVLRCAQAMLDIGYGLHFIWLGGEAGESLPHPRIRETRLPKPRSFLDRALALLPITKCAWKSNAHIWHIHDFYMLPFAKVWARSTKNLVIYDVHEYYPEYYSRRDSVPIWLQPTLERIITSIEKRLASKMAVSAVSEVVTKRFLSAGITAVSTPNYPSLGSFRKAKRQLTAALLRRVVHIGTLSPTWGSEIIVKIAMELALLSPEIELIVVSRFHSDAAKASFSATLAKIGLSPNLKFIDPMPAHKIAEFLATCGIGISTVQNVGELPFTINTKLYEYTMMGLAIVASDLPATRHFIETSATGILAPPDNAKAFAKAIVELINNAEKVCAEVNQKAAIAIETMSWEKTCSPRLQSLLQDQI